MNDQSYHFAVPVLDAGELPVALEALTAARIKSLPAAAMVGLQDLLDEMAGKIDLARKTLQAALDDLYGGQVRAKLVTTGRDTGTVHMTDGPLNISVEIKKNVTWAQQGPDSLAALAQRIAEGGEEPGQYIDIKYSVSERKFEAWPETLKAPFRKARTVKPGRPTFHLKLDEEVC